MATAAGGAIGLDYALKHPERVHSLVIADSIGGVQDQAYLEVQCRLRPPKIQGLPVELRELGPSYRGINTEGTHRCWPSSAAAARRGPLGRASNCDAR